MILQFKGFNNNITYEEAELITVSACDLPKIETDLAENHSLEKIREITERAEKVLREQTNCANIKYITDKPIYELGVVKVVMLDDKNKHCTYVFDTDVEAYLLSNSGKTIRKV